MLNRTDLRDLIEITLLNIQLTGAVVEKDYYVTQVIHNTSNIENEYFRLVFAGGTCLAKAHRIVSRMSEDIDFKIQIKKNNAFSRSRLIKELKEFRKQITSSLSELSLETVENTARNEGKYQRVILKYPHIYPLNTTLRPNILLEFTLSDIRLPVDHLTVKTIIEEVTNNILMQNTLKTCCISVDETAIEKWVGLTRRIIAIERQYHTDDSTLVRHIYDLNAIENANMINDSFFALAQSIIMNDAKQFQNQHPEYCKNPAKEIQESLAILKNKPVWKQHYQTFLSEMVYNPSAAADYESAISNIENLSKKIIGALSPADVLS